ncbi:MAG TPA: PQQ-dependent sugar dehydrogenase, partial [Pseudobdellovibrionaceae bacterium]
LCALSLAEAKKLPLEKLSLPPGFSISVFAKAPGARSLAVTPSGVVFVGSRGLGDEHNVYRIKNNKVEIIASGFKSPNGVAFKDGKLYVSDISQVTEFTDPENKTGKDLNPRILPQKFPSDVHHGWKFIRFGPDGKLYVPVGANCNICDPGTEYARIFRIDVNGTSKEELAQGIRNTVGFDFHPQTKELWFTDNGRDWLGDDSPPDEVNHLTKIGQHFGFPYCHGKNTQDPEFTQKKCADLTPPVVELRAHVAALGMRFYSGSSFPADYKDQIILAEHGSWNRAKPQGYRLTLVRLKNGEAAKAEAFIEGWLQGADAWGRPVDVEMYKDGSLLVSDDKAGVVYRVSYSPPKK